VVVGVFGWAAVVLLLPKAAIKSKSSDEAVEAVLWEKSIASNGLVRLAIEPFFLFWFVLVSYLLLIAKN
jgi:hypothetical protein